ncbi:MAG: FliM/FliN family flagellar motor switch protein [Fimbriiglobus sp.]|jgi:flagellar motor switch protein FliM|nr:FliM/FliN family flagellar motor switch protein [Fimbriiglobus sp.]
MMPVPFDFRRPPPGELEWQTSEWLAEAARLATATWAKLLTFQAEPVAAGVVPTTAGAGMLALPNNAIGFAVRPVNATPDDDEGFLLAVPRPLLLTLLAGLMNEIVEGYAPDRELTPLEPQLLDYVVRELLLNPLEAAWPLRDKPRWQAGPGGQPRNVWRVAPADPAVLATMTVTTPFGDQTFHLMFTRSVRLLRLADPPPPKAAPQSDSQKRHIEALVREMPVDLTVTLGSSDLTLFDLAKLQPGDLLVLQQKVTEPLPAAVGGADKFRVWPGAVAGRAAVQIHQVVDQA